MIVVRRILFALALAVPAAPALAQAIKPLDVERDPNGVDVFSGQVATRLPVLSIPAAPNLRFEKLQDLVPHLDGMISSNPNGPSSATLSVNGGGASSDRFSCTDGECPSAKRNGATIISPTTNVYEYYQGGTGKLIVFDQQNGVQGIVTPATGVSFYASVIVLPDGESLSFDYDATTIPDGRVIRRPVSVTSSTGYTLTLAYQTNTYGQNGWNDLGQATIHATATPAIPLARLTYSGNTVTDLNGREWTCTYCRNALIGTGTETTTTVRLPTETVDAFQAEAQQRTYGSVTHANWVTRIGVDGVDWNYAYVPGHIPQTTISKVTVTGPLGFSRVVNIYQTAMARPRITSTVDSLGRTTTYEYDNDVRVNRIVHPEGNAEAVVYDMIGNIKEGRRVAKPGTPLTDIVQTAYYGDHDPWTGDLCYWAACYQPSWTRDALGRQTDYAYNSFGQLAEQTEPADAVGVRRKTMFSYTWTGGASRRTAEIVCGESAASTTCGTNQEYRTETDYWGGTGLPWKVRRIDLAAGVTLTTTMTYDDAGRLLETDGPLPGSDDKVYNRYDIHGRRTWEIGPRDANGYRQVRKTTYRDNDDNLTVVETGYVTDPNALALTAVTARTDVTYDERRNVKRSALSAAGTTYQVADSSFDARGRLVCRTVRMNAAFSSLPADACTPGAEGTQGPDRITKSFYDAAGQLLQVREGVGTAVEAAEATYAYTPNGKKKLVIDAGGNKAELRYDRFDRQVRWVFPAQTALSESAIEAFHAAAPDLAASFAGTLNEGDYEEHGYDLVGHRISLRKRDNSVIGYEYDALGRMTRKTIPDRAGLDPSDVRDVAYTYDLRGLVTDVRFVGGVGLWVGYGYDGFGRQTVSKMNDYPVLNYHYDAAGNRTRLTFTDGNYVTYEYDALGRPTAIKRNGSAVIAAYTYTPSGERDGFASGTGLATGYLYHPAGRLQTLTTNLTASGWNNQWNFAYNPAAQLASLTRSNDLFAWSPQNRDLVYSPANGLNQYQTATTAIGTANFCYDANGNLTADGGSVYKYDVENRLIERRAQVSTACPTQTTGYTGALQARLRYDVMGRLEQVAGASGNATHLIYDGDALVIEYSQLTAPPYTSTVLRRYVHGADAKADDPIAWYEGAGFTGTEERHLRSDWQGSIVLATDSSGSTVHGVNRYDEYGIPQAGNLGRFGYTGQTWIPELAMWYYKARIYSPMLGRFMQTDPIGYEGGNSLYAYVGNDPVNLVDPDGMIAAPNACSRLGAMSCSGSYGAIETASGGVKRPKGLSENGSYNTPQPRNPVKIARDIFCAIMLLCGKPVDQAHPPPDVDQTERKPQRPGEKPKIERTQPVVPRSSPPAGQQGGQGSGTPKEEAPKGGIGAGILRALDLILRFPLLIFPEQMESMPGRCGEDCVA